MARAKVSAPVVPSPATESQEATVTETTPVAAPAPADTKLAAVNALLTEHFAGDPARLIRTMLNTVDRETALRACFGRTWNADRTEARYYLAGETVACAKGKDGLWRFGESRFAAKDRAGNERTNSFGRDGDPQATESRATKNGLAAWRNGVLWAITERETERAASAPRQTAEHAGEIARLEQRAKDAETAAARTEKMLERLLAKVDPAALAALTATEDAG